VGRWIAASAAAAATVALAACGGESSSGVAACGDDAPDGARVVVEEPRSGEEVSSGFEVKGCSSTFEGNVRWRLRGRDGRVVASGFTQGGSLEAAVFEFEVNYEVEQRELAQLDVFESRVTEEGFPPPKDIVPLLLSP